MEIGVKYFWLNYFFAGQLAGRRKRGLPSLKVKLEIDFFALFQIIIIWGKSTDPLGTLDPLQGEYRGRKIGKNQSNIAKMGFF